MTARLRLLLAWLVMAAIPLQGLAAVSMMVCRAAGDDLKAHAVPIGPAHHHVVHHDGGPFDAASASPEGEPACAICVSCCHSVAISELPPVDMAETEALTCLAEPPATMDSLHLPVPDKPPRS